MSREKGGEVGATRCDGRWARPPLPVPLPRCFTRERSSLSARAVELHLIDLCVVGIHNIDLSPSNQRTPHARARALERAKDSFHLSRSKPPLSLDRTQQQQQQHQQTTSGAMEAPSPFGVGGGRSLSNVQRTSKTPGGGAGAKQKVREREREKGSQIWEERVSVLAFAHARTHQLSLLPQHTTQQQQTPARPLHSQPRGPRP